jgi:hypothetical protein
MELSVSRWKDTLGIVASVGCAVHCAATPVLLAFLPSLKLTDWMASPQFHQVAAILCVGLVSISIWPAFRQFRDYRVLGLSSMGLGLVIAAAFFLPDQCCSHSLTSAPSLENVQQVGLAANSDRSASLHTNCDCETHSVFAKKRLGSSEHLVSFASISTSDEPPARDLDPSPQTAHDHSHAVAGSSFLASIQPWLTPLGGLLLVLAHGLNIRRQVGCSKSCRCSSKDRHQRNSDEAFVNLGSTKAA